MDTNTQKLILKEGLPAMVPLCKVAVTNRMRQKKLDHHFETEKELAEIKAKKMQNPNSRATTSPSSDEMEMETTVEVEQSADPLENAARMAEQLDQQLQQTLDMEDCGFCRDVLVKLRQKPLDVQTQGLRELQKLHTAMYEDGSRNAVNSVMDEMEIVPRLMIEAED